MTGVPGRGRSAAGHRAARPAPRDAGMVTAELAVGLPTLALVLVAAVAVVVGVTEQLRCVDAAAVAARLAARGELHTDAVARARAVAPPHASVTLTSERDVVRADVTAPVALPLLGRWSVVHVHAVEVAACAPPDCTGAR